MVFGCASWNQNSNRKCKKAITSGFTHNFEGLTRFPQSINQSVRGLSARITTTRKALDTPLIPELPDGQKSAIKLGISQGREIPNTKIESGNAGVRLLAQPKSVQDNAAPLLVRLQALPSAPRVSFNRVFLGRRIGPKDSTSKYPAACPGGTGSYQFRERVSRR